SIPDGWFMKYASTHTDYEAHLAAQREFEGSGPMVTWDASLGLLGNERVGRLALDWSIGGGMLFGKQDTAITGHEKATVYELFSFDTVGGYDSAAPGTPAIITVTEDDVGI